MNPLGDLLYFLLPNRCLHCGRTILPQQKILCVECASHLPEADEQTIDNFVKNNKDIEGMFCLFTFSKEGIVQDLLHNLKYQGREDVGVWAGKELARKILSCQMPTKIDMVIPVPVSEKKIKKRGYNQVTSMAKTIAKDIGGVFAENVYLYKDKEAKSLVGKNWLLRQTGSKKEIFKATRTQELKGKTILIVDDIVTTGKTITTCVNALKEKDNKIYVCSIAHTQKY